MEPDSSPPYTQVHATRPYPEPNPSSPHDPSNFLKIHLNIILASTFWSPLWPYYLRLNHQQPVHPSILPHTRYMPCQSHSSRGRSHYLSLMWKYSLVSVVLLRKITSQFMAHIAPYVKIYRIYLKL